jgi:hypothetical protein
VCAPLKSNGKMQQDEKSDVDLEDIGNSGKYYLLNKRMSEKTMEMM